MNTDNNSLISSPNQNKIAHYRILRKLGQGGMSIVYEGIDERLKRAVAIKVLHPYLAETLEYRLRFFREAEVVARLTHPNIVKIFDVSNALDKEQLYIVTELLVGETLKDFVRSIRIEEFPELSSMIIWKITHALDHAHQKGVIHRDIKPENIMICSDGQIKLMDFGIASIGNDEGLTRSGALLGSLSHLSPEAIKGHKTTALCDIYSLTTIFFWLLTKELPFIKDTPHALLKAIVDMPHQKVQCLSPVISDDLADIVEKGMHKEPTMRFQSARLMGDAIENALLQMGILINNQQLEEVLKDPEGKIIHFDTAIREQIKKQIEIYKLEKNDKGMLALSCRLDATTLRNYELSNHEDKKPTQNKAIKIGIVFTVITALVLIVTLLFLQKPKANDAQLLSLDGITEIQASDLSYASEVIPAISNEPVIAKEPAKLLDNKILPIKTLMQEVEIIVWPFANIIVDGKTIARDKKSIKIKLARGTHKISFTHKFAATVDKIIHIDEIGELMVLNVSLTKSKPAFLVVKTNIDADVAVSGSYRGSAKKSLLHPIIIPLPDKTHAVTKEIIISEVGYKPFIAEIEFIAGHTKEINVSLTPLL